MNLVQLDKSFLPSMNRPLAISLLWLLAITVTSGSDLFAQNGSFIPVDHWSYQYIARLQRRGMLLELHPTRLPYTVGELKSSLKSNDAKSQKEIFWVEALRDFVSGNGKEIGIVAEAELDLINSERKDLLRPLGEDVQAFSRIHLRMFYESGGFIGQIGGSHNLYYDEDPDGLDAANRLIARNEESYLGYSKEKVKAYLGRFKNHWAPTDQTALLLSSNANSFDQLFFRLGGKSLSLTSVYGELDSWSTQLGYTGRAGNRGSGESETPIRRYLAAHRIDWRPLRNLTLSFMESSLISGPNAGISLRYLNPLSNFLLMVDNSPKNEENNGFIAGSLWAYHNQFTLQGQLLVDDLDLKFGDEPGSLALAMTSTYSGIDFADIGFQFDLVSGRVYNTEQDEGQYLYLLRGIGTQFNDYLSYGTFLEHSPSWLAGGFIRLNFDLLILDDDGRITKDFPEDDASFLFDNERGHILRESVGLFYRPRPWAQLEANFGFNQFTHREQACEECSETTTDHSGSKTLGHVKLKLDMSKLGKLRSW